ncbi:uncharacterized protein LOC124555182 isoform X1 [Schistocerca americana]|uniref:uncharacterized protein LOC124555182 isoform X1 n=2 Tax=Schistocerca americana TaxID=7009 RepID=UPI001F4F35DE|nr:uncharacterized protein LOC124555182 isoform X1 [Schistocerca americana]
MSQKQITSAAFAKRLMTLLSGSRFGEVMWTRCSTSALASGQVVVYEPVSDFVRHVKRALQLKERVVPQFEKNYCLLCETSITHRSPWVRSHLEENDKTRNRNDVPGCTANYEFKISRSVRNFTKKLELFSSDGLGIMILKRSMSSAVARAPLATEVTCSSVLSVVEPQTPNEESGNVSYKNNGEKLENELVMLQNENYAHATLIPERILRSVDQPTTDSGKPTNEKPTKEQQQHVYETLKNTLPKLFVQPMDYSIYHPEIIFENNIRGTITQGIVPYVCQIAAVRVVGHLKFAFVKMDVLKITLHVKEKMVKVRWRIRGISASKVFLYFWKYKIWNMDGVMEEFQETWYDGFSIYCIGEDGRVIKHIVDKVMPDDDTCPANIQNPSPLTANS